MALRNARVENLSLLLSVCFLTIVSCTSPYKKAGKGNEYKILSADNGKKLVYGNFIEFHLKTIYKDYKKDTVLGDTRDYMPRLEPFDSSRIPSEYIDIFNKAGKGDSIVIRLSVDSAYNNDPGRKIPAFMKEGGFVYTTIKILNIFENQYQADSADIAQFKKNELKIYNKNLETFEKEIEKNRSRIQEDSKIIKEHLDEKGIKYIKGNWGTFIVIHDEGKGEKIKYNNVVAVNYTAKTFDSNKVFNSNIDPKFKNTGPYEVTMSKLGSVMAGWTDALMKLNDGAKATIYIPSALAYGKKGFLPAIKPNENIIFEIEIIKMITEVQAMEIVRENQHRRAEEARQKHNNSLQIPSPFGTK